LRNQQKQAATQVQDAGFLLVLLFNPEDGGDMFLRNVGCTDPATNDRRAISCCAYNVVYATFKYIYIVFFVDRRQLCNLPVKETTGDSQQPGPDIEIYRLGVQLFERSL
jgi:hypothetical protein